ncbi:aspartate-semialdehyde dehydrogenase [Saccharothrix syringae]|uniref:Aspartate-semialdehyde dehydrogenase n=1 Tax=Saccharothrix syringae TaxID=103733 RepID=A0A5Q0GXW4_SACSY|nr:aspartate-semialdehyde dehydrogenase [Saccharothrix syringae]QFZ18789.1 aspartate-semialdehyde dehydrogenase [Saccharothrix syringae]
MVMSAAAAPPRLVVVGATGAVGSALLELVGEKSFAHRELVLCASHRSTGRQVVVGGAVHRVRHASADEVEFTRGDLVFLCAGEEVSRGWAKAACAAGALVIDLSGAFHRDRDVPLIVPEVNGHLLDRHPHDGPIACPSPMAAALARLLHRWQEAYGVRQVVLSTYQAATRLGRQGVEELLEGAELALQDPDAELPAHSTPFPLAFNAVPVVGRVLHNRFTAEEQRLAGETRRLLGRPWLNVTATCVQVPVVSGDSAAVLVEAESPVPRGDLVSLLASLPRVRVYDAAPPESAGPTPLTAVDPDVVHVGRVRVTPHDPRAVWLWITFDSLRAAGALNALHTARLALALAAERSGRTG